MKNRFVVTITDINGSKQYNIHQYVKQIILYVILLVVVIFFFSFISIQLLLKEVRQIEVKRDLMQEEYLKINEKNEELQALIDEKTEELVKVSDRIEDLEGIVGLSDQIVESQDLSLIERVDLASITGAQKAFVMQLIPNGAPLRGNYRITSDWGTRVNPVLRRTHLHTGIDFGLPIGTPIYAPADGVAYFANNSYNGGYGIMVKLEHSFGFSTFYAHLSKIVVKKGDFVRRGQIIAYSGNSGRSTGPHLHYEIRYLSQDVNPRPFIEWTMRDYTKIFEKEKSVKWQSLLTMINQLVEIQETPALLRREQK
ncbi:peptidoglycan DD-metalloendopeptidase family protein [Helicobacter winghamensis]|uniref:Peptidase M23 n=1 Tax=Helicobacter winghamensis TaxID=157268 RepID=A0A2N3PL80_9HELI|nr:M23 family metallopeptidase [Helicobacter winghamensis]EEO26733.1 peptidase, M23 family [Helicobacter winghamensis ATCC BAA-430]PKT79525.1 peptidase M23 [Helicobacter winghamensis]PKT79643.1 peptidase M23 [Helicobacter winghamensis]PKT79696.1 peptidase M23 [Helicobacter winghamensis]PKT82494.1 peptidase M23 [Helicobacter winghamensis]